MITSPAEALRLMLEPGSVSELRVLNAGAKRTVSGYFNDPVKMGAAAAHWSGRAPGVYFVLNPVLPDLLARAHNHCVEFAKTATSDREIVKRHVLPLDFDVKRPAGISSTNEEHEAALAKARECREWLRQKGWPEPMFGDSGNGAHLNYRVDLPVETTLVERVLAALSKRFDSDLVKIDASMHNAARIWKAYGTLACKGDSTATRPHRLSALIDAPDPWLIVRPELLQELVGPEAKLTGQVHPSRSTRKFDLDAWLDKYRGQLPPMGQKRPWDGSGWKREFDTCPWNAEHFSTSAFIGKGGDGKIGAGCRHDSCKHNSWATLKALVGDTTTGRNNGYTRRHPAEKTSNPATGTEAPPFSEDALALRFSDRNPELRWTEKWGKWHHWTGRKFEEDRAAKVFELAREVCRAAGQACTDKNLAARVASAKTRAAVISEARHDPRHSMLPEQWDADDNAISTPIGIVDLYTGELRAARISDFSTKITASGPADFIRSDSLWLKFLDRVTGGDSELQSFLQRVAGYCLTGSVKAEAVFFFYGGGQNGKSKFLGALSDLMHEYYRVAPVSLLLATKNDHHPTELAGLHAARLVTAIEAKSGQRWDEAKLCALTGGDVVTARYMRGDFFDFLPKFKILVAANHKPGLINVNKAVTRRLHLIPFTVTIPDAERDFELAEKLRGEQGQIFRWAIDGCLEWRRIGLAPPSSVRAATEEYFAAQDVIARWLSERCETGVNCREKTTDLFNDWTKWTEAQKETTGKKRVFTEELQRRGFELGGQGRHFLYGIHLIDAQQAGFEPEES